MLAAEILDDICVRPGHQMPQSVMGSRLEFMLDNSCLINIIGAPLTLNFYFCKNNFLWNLRICTDICYLRNCQCFRTLNSFSYNLLACRLVQEMMRFVSEKKQVH